ncbi:hypothetical protein GCM10011325_36530 [Dyadobacter sediminis]|jgi:hypothetical protein|nr:hypothetical protein GCM10011325_36530 [Dyadobacter sediminis]
MAKHQIDDLAIKARAHCQSSKHKGFPPVWTESAWSYITALTPLHVVFPTTDDEIEMA